MNRIVPSFIFSMCLLGSPLVIASNAMADHGHWHKGGHFKEMLEDLDLTQAQKDQIKTIVKDKRENFKGNREQMKESWSKLSDVIEAEQFDESKVREAIRAMSKMKEDMAVERARTASQVMKVLTPEQRAKLKENRKKRAAKFEERVKEMREKGDDFLDD